MRRREFIAGLGSVAAWPQVLSAQQSARMRQIAILQGTADDSEGRAHITAFRRELEARGWTEDRNIRTVLRWTAGNIDSIRSSAKEIVDQKPELIVAETTPGVAAVARASGTIPIVFVNVVHRGGGRGGVASGGAGRGAAE
jgi:putative ABC transport system substrate-binding protein